MDLIYAKEFYRIKHACIEVKEHLGNGFLEKVYESALYYELQLEGFCVESQKGLSIDYKGHIVGEYRADIVIDEKIIIELKTAEKITDYHRAQLINYLKLTEYKLGVLVNFPNNRFGVEIERLVNT